MKKKIVAAALAAGLLMGGAVGGTVAWLVSSTIAVTNTFTMGDINITLSETTGTDYPVVPGATIAKDPKVTVKKDSEPCYLFIKVTENNNSFTKTGETTPSDIIIWDVNDTWIKYTAETNADVWYKTITSKTDADTDYYILLRDSSSTAYANGYVQVDSAVKKGTVTSDNKPTLSFQAAAVQSANMADVHAAYKEVVWN